MHHGLLQRLEKEMEELVALLQNYKICLQRAKIDNLKSTNMFNGLGATVAGFQEGRENFKT